MKKLTVTVAYVFLCQEYSASTPEIIACALIVNSWSRREWYTAMVKADGLYQS